MNNNQEVFPGGITFSTGGDCFPLSTDTMVLADFVRLKSKSNVADLCSGSAPLGLLLCGTNPTCHVTGVELHEPSHAMALQNIANNHLEHRIKSLLGDIREIRELLPAGSFDCVIANPPYFSSGALSQAHPAARQECTCNLEDVFSAAAWLLPTGGSFFLVHKPERLSDVLVYARQYTLEAKELQLVCSRSGDAPSLMLVRCRRGGKPGLRILPSVVLHQEDGTFSHDYRRIYHMD